MAVPTPHFTDGAEIISIRYDAGPLPRLQRYVVPAFPAYERGFAATRRDLLSAYATLLPVLVRSSKGLSPYFPAVWFSSFLYSSARRAGWQIYPNGRNR